MNIAKIVITIDDGHDNVYTNALPIMEKYGLVGTACIITSSVGSTGKVTTNQLSEMQNKGWEIASHSVTHPLMTTLSEAEQRIELADSKTFLEQNGITVNTFAPPSRDWNDISSVYAEEEGYKAVRALDITSTPTEPYPISNKLYVRHGSTSINSAAHSPIDVFNWIETAISEGSLLTLLFHHIRDVSDNYSTSLSDFEAICAYLKKRSLDGEILVDTFYNSLNATLKKLENEPSERILLSDRNITI
ncbi:polysaccharide deacetylase family protein [Pseudalkalibacillus caeni]|uniref:NodB homology domain-containing protein n=1 Tax=Exobacillus caeni TaxID=2574798 RepID=A0A5R9FA41_9BACL|nr:polysaccharide deacetylase family protein [Pseudalkalibacillus caeni]TLS37733.1 hypothetical protein FCL54_07880 [Pseudalkalibacillus caeni]